MAAQREIGRLVEVPIREVWAHEALEFTPWLLANQDALATALGIELELEANEHAVGAFSLDLLGTDQTTSGRLIVENQFGQSDHGHLGQLLTYAAGTDAATIVWIAEIFRDEHRAAVTWLNQTTRPDVRFFAVQLAAVRIGDSMPAPLLKVVVQPSDFQKSIGAATGGGGGDPLLVAFWQPLVDRLAAERPDIEPRTSAKGSNYLTLRSPLGRGSGASLYCVLGAGHLRTELYIDAGDQQRSRAIFGRLVERREEIEQRFGGPLVWEADDAKTICKVYTRRDGRSGLKARPDEHGEAYDWFADTATRLFDAVRGATEDG